MAEETGVEAAGSVGVTRVGAQGWVVEAQAAAQAEAGAVVKVGAATVRGAAEGRVA